MTDVTVVGGGVFGLAVAHVCAGRGARVRLLERQSVAAGASGGPVGALAPHVPENWNAKKAFQFDSLVSAATFWPEVERASGRSTGYGRTGRLQPLADPAAVALARARETTAAQFWHDTAVWRVEPDPRDGWCPPCPSGFAVRDTLTARLDPPQACAALAAALLTAGGRIETGIEAGPAQDLGNGPVVWATGAAGLGMLSTDLGRDVGAGVKGQALRLRFDARHQPQLFVDGIHIVPHADGTVAVGSTSERDYADTGTTAAALDALLARAVAACPALAGAPVIAGWAGIRPRARSRAPMLGPWPGRPGHFIANGGFKIGFGMAPQVAGVMADLVLDGIDRIPHGFCVRDSL